MGEKLTGIRKIAVLRANALGDFIAITPVLRALRETYPDAEIVYLGRAWHKAFLESRPGPVDRVIVLPFKQGVSDDPHKPDQQENPEELEAFFAEMQREQFDLALQMHGGGANSNPFTLRLGARITAGMKTPDAPELDYWIPYIYYQNEFMRLMEVARLVGVTTCDIEPRVEVTAVDMAEVRQKLPPLNRYAVLHPGASDNRRRWYPERFARVGDALAEKGIQVVLTGIPQERETVDAVIREMHHSAIDACGVVSLGGLAALLAGASVMISNDTGPLHLADAVGTPTVGIYWCGNIINWSHFWRTTHRPLPSWMIICPVCGENIAIEHMTACAHDACFVEAVSVKEVITASFDVMAQAERMKRESVM